MPGIQLKTCQIKNYRTIGNAALDFSQGAVGLIGPNGSGKTNLARALDFYCTIITQWTSGGVGKGAEDAPVTHLEWAALHEPSPSAVFGRPSVGQSCHIGATFSIAAHLVPKQEGNILTQLDPRAARHEFEIAATLTAQDFPDGSTRLAPKFNVVVDGKSLTRRDLLVIKNLWKQFQTSRLQALHPASEFLDAIRSLKGKSVRGLNAYEQTNKAVLDLSPNFARVDFLDSGPRAIEAHIPDLNLDNMGSGNLRALQLLFSGIDPRMANAILIHIEEPESHFHPGLQRMAMRKIIELSRRLDRVVSIETHSPHVLRELYANEVPVYRVEVVDRDKITRLRRSEVRMLPAGDEAADLLNSLGAEAGFALLGGVLIVTDGPTDVPVYRQFFSLFEELSELLTCFVPMGCLESRELEFKGISQLAQHVVVLADGHFQQDQGAGLRSKCEDSGVKYFQLDHWGAENFFSLEALRKASEEIGGLEVGEDVTLDAQSPLGKTGGISGFSKRHHMVRVAKHVSRAELEQAEDFMALVDHLRSLAHLEHGEPGPG